MENMYTATKAAEVIGCSQSTVSRWAKVLGYADKKYGNSLTLTIEQVREIEDKWKHQSGNPNFGRKAS